MAPLAPTAPLAHAWFNLVPRCLRLRF
jgi:hypothetical protein